MSRQDKATSERHTKMLRELVKRPDNKVCADCKRNDPRWASWNLGVFLCIRCSGIHRGMGTHISKVKSVDLDVWTPEQMDSIQKWGNKRANLYWEAHLKAGHIPPDHKMESFIRSKYESRRWALDGPPPRDPSVLEDGSAIPDAPSAPATPPPPARTGGTAPPVNSRVAVSRQPQPRELLSTAVAGRNHAQRAHVPASAPAPLVQAEQKKPEPENDLFSLDFHAPAASTSPPPSAAAGNSNKKLDIMSLYSTPAAQPQTQGAFGQFGGGGADQWGGFASASTAAPPPQPVQPTSMIGSSGAGAWGTSSGWTVPAPPPAQGNLWGTATSPTAQPPMQSSLLGGSDVWGSSAPAPAHAGGGTGGGGGDLFGAFAGTGAGQQKKDDAFGDLWGGFK